MISINSDISLNEVCRALSCGSSEEDRVILEELMAGYESMRQENLRFLSEVKKGLFSLYKKQMSCPDKSNAFKLGVSMAMKEQGIRFEIRDEEKILKLIQKMEQERIRLKAMYGENCPV